MTPKRERCTATLMGADGNVHECEYPLDAHEWHRIKSVRWTDSAPGATPHRPSIEWIDRQISEQWAPALKRMAEGATPHRPAEPPSGHQPLTAAEMAQAKQIAEEILAEEILAEDEPSREACSAALPVVQSLRIALSDASVSTIKARAEIARALDAFAKAAVEVAIAETRERCALVVEDAACGCGDNSAILIRKNDVPGYEDHLIAKKIKAAVEAEREACAEAIEHHEDICLDAGDNCHTRCEYARDHARVIRARGAK